MNAGNFKTFKENYEFNLGQYSDFHFQRDRNGNATSLTGLINMSPKLKDQFINDFTNFKYGDIIDGGSRKMKIKLRESNIKIKEKKKDTIRH